MGDLIGGFAVATAGHDKDKIYVIIGQQEKFLLLADGKEKTLTNPKKKNRKHAQLIDENEFSLTAKFKEGETVTSENVKRAIKLLKKSQAAE